MIRNERKNDVNLVIWCCENHLLPDDSVKYRKEINELKRNNKQNIALTNDPHVLEILSSSNDLFIDVLKSKDKLSSIDVISQKYMIQPKRIAVIYDSKEPFKIEDYNVIKTSEVMHLLDIEQNQNTYALESLDVLKYREKRFESREEAITLLREINKKYDLPWARHELIDLLVQSNNLKEHSEAYEICKASSVKDPEMKFKLARMYKMGIGTDKDMKNYMSNLKESMLSGSNKAKYEWIRNVITNRISDEYENAVELMDESDPQLRGFLAKMYSLGYGVKKDLDKAIELMESSGADGVGWARNELTDLLIQRNRGDDFKQAFEKCSDFASEGDVWAKGRLARMYRDGIGTDKDMDKAKSLMSEAAVGGVPWAKNELAEILREHVKSQIPQSISKRLFNSTEQAFEEIESIYEKSPESAKSILIEIEELNKMIMNPDIKANLIKQKVMSDENSAKALNDLINLALSGNKTASKMLGTLYYEGNKVDKNLDFAITYTRLSLKDKTGREVNKLTDLLMERGNDEDLTEAFEICLRSSQEGDAWSTARLGRMYKIGKGVEKNMDKAIEYFRTASDAGVPWAKDELKWLLGRRDAEQDVKELKKMK